MPTKTSRMLNGMATPYVTNAVTGRAYAGKVERNPKEVQMTMEEENPHLHGLVPYVATYPAPAMEEVVYPRPPL